MNEVPDHYEVLQVSPNADREIIEAAYRRLARRYDPVRDSTAASAERLKAVEAAFRVLKDPISRAEFDTARVEDLRPEGKSRYEPAGQERLPRAARRRQERVRSRPSTRPLLSQRDLAIVGALAVVAIAVGLAAFLLAGRGGGGEGSAADRQAIETLAKRSIEVLPQGQWPSLYASFTPDFQKRCAEPDFIKAGATGAEELGENLPLLAFVRLDTVSIGSDSASAVIVGQLTGQSEYSVQGAFQKVGGEWRIAPAPNTNGCEAFERLSG